MIRINLLGEEAVADDSNNALIAGYVGSLVLTALLCLYLHMSVSGEIREFTQQKEGLERDLRVLKQTTNEVHELEKKRDDLKSKLTVIALLKKSKVGPVHVMEAINDAIPERAWVTDVKEKEGEMMIVGLALDNISVSDFVKQLQGSEYFPSVEIVESKSAQWRDAVIRQFSLRSKVNYAGRILPVANQVSPGGATSSTGSAPAKSGTVS